MNLSIKIGLGSCGLAAGAGEVYKAIEKYLAEKKWDIKKFDNVFKSKKRKNCAPPAPAHGLYLAKVIY